MRVQLPAPSADVQPSAGRPRIGRRTAAMVAAIVLLTVTLLTYWPVRQAQFSAWDDRDQILLNPDFNPPRLARLLAYAAGPYRGSLYPLSYGYLAAVAALDRAIERVTPAAPLDPRLFHLASVLLHAGAAMLVWLVLRRIGFGWDASLVGALLFAVHPVQADAVAWASGFNTVLCGVFSLAALGLYVPSRQVRRGFPWRQIGATVCYGLALAAKPSAVVVPLLAGCLEWAAQQPAGRRGRLRLLLGWLLLAVPVMLVTRRIQGAGGVTPTPLWTRPIVASDAIAFYVRQVVLPIRLLVDYGRSPARLMASGQWHHTWIITALLAAMLIVAARRRWTMAAAGMTLFVAGLVPVLGLTPFNGQTISTVADRFLYLSMLGVAMLAALAWRGWRRRWIVAAGIVAAIALLAARTNLRAAQWRDDPTLMAADLRGNPDSLPAHEIFGQAAAAAGQNQRAAAEFAAALRVNPTDARIPFDLANALLRSGRAADAIPYYQLAEADQLRNAPAEPLDPRIFYNHGLAELAIGDVSGARGQFERALAIAPGYPLARAALDRLDAMRSNPPTSRK